MIVAFNRFYLREPWATTLRERFLGLKPSSHQHPPPPGLYRSRLLVPAETDLPHTSAAFWQDMAHLRAWVRSDAFKASHGPNTPDRIPDEAYFQRRVIEMYELAADEAPEWRSPAPFQLIRLPQALDASQLMGHFALTLLKPLGAGQPWVLVDPAAQVTPAHLAACYGEGAGVVIERYREVLAREGVAAAR